MIFRKLNILIEKSFTGLPVAMIEVGFHLNQFSPINNIASSSSTCIPEGSQVQEDICTNFKGLDNMEALLRDTMGMIGQLGGQELHCQLFNNTFDAQDDGGDRQDSNEDKEELA